jgi:hypothetical protein
VNVAQLDRLSRSWSKHLARRGFGIGKPYARFWGAKTHCGQLAMRVDLLAPDGEYCESHERPKVAVPWAHAWICSCPSCDWVYVWEQDNGMADGIFG